MNSSPFQPSDLAELDVRVLARADRVVSMRDVFGGDTDVRVIGLRHDVDDNRGSLDTALRMARWEAERGYCSTYYLLHDTHYWGEEMLPVAAEMESLGHEVGLHNNGMAVALKTGRDPFEVVAEALALLRSAVTVTSTAGHGDGMCRKVGFVNDEIWQECRRPDWGDIPRTLTFNGKIVDLAPRPLADFGLEFDSIWLDRGAYLSDSGGEWSNGYSDGGFDEIADGFPFAGQLHMLVHPDWWSQAFSREAVAA